LIVTEAAGEEAGGGGVVRPGVHAGGVAYVTSYIATNFLGHGTVNPKANESDD
jgi:hypothetical protein